MPTPPPTRAAAPRCVLLAITAAACVHRAPPPWTADVRVEGLHPTGNLVYGDPDLPPLDPSAPATAGEGRRTARAAHALVQHPHGRWLPLLNDLQGETPWPPIDLEALDADAERVRAWFVEQGWTLATVRAVDGDACVWWCGPEERKRWHTLHLIVDPGDRQAVGTASMQGADHLDPHLHATMVDALPPRGTPASDAALQRAAAQLRALLAGDGHPFAEVNLQVEALPDDPLTRDGQTAVAVTFTVTAGPSPLTTPPQLTVAPGLHAAPLGRAIGRWLPEGRPWDGERLDWIERRLRDHPEVADVAIVAVPATAGAATPVFHLTPQPRRDVTAALSTDAPGALLGLGAEVHATWRGLGGHLASLRSDTTAVWRLFDGPPGGLVRQAQTGPYLREQLTLTTALAPLARLDLRVAAAGELVTQRGYMYGAGRGELGLALRPSSHVTLWAGVRGGYVQYFPGIQQEAPFAEAFSGQALARAHDLFAVVLAADVDTAPGEALPTRGFRLHLEASPWGSAAGSAFSRVEGRLEGYASPVEPLTLVVRAGAGLHQHDDSTGALLANRFFLGGLTDVRGFGYRRLGAPGSRGGLEDVYVGGDAMLWASLEAQVRLHPDVLAAAFTDVGRIWDTPSPSGALPGERAVSMLDLVPTSGLGLLVRTPIGGVGGWLGARWFQDVDMIDAPPRFAFHFRTITQF